MEEQKKKQLEAKLRQLLAVADLTHKEKKIGKIKLQKSPRVIRRRKGAPDLLIA